MSRRKATKPTPDPELKVVALPPPPDAGPSTPEADARPRVALALPYYNELSPACARGFAHPTFGAVDITTVIESCTSSTPNAFNKAWLMALDARDRGDADYFVMLHSDIGPQAGWIDILWREMSQHKADLISAISPIKDDSHRTSTAIGGPDPWFPRRFIKTVHHDILPTTFGIDDIPHAPDEVLLVNTGCMMLDMRRTWWGVPTSGGPGGEGFAFEFRTRIATVPEQQPDGTIRRVRIAQFAPEDWLMSRHVAEHGGKVMATWAVELEHRGARDWKAKA